MKLSINTKYDIGESVYVFINYTQQILLGYIQSIILKENKDIEYNIFCDLGEITFKSFNIRKTKKEAENLLFNYRSKKSKEEPETWMQNKD
jgi:hypothetical protein